MVLSTPPPTVVTTRVARVTVYQNGALVVRRGHGAGVVEMHDLPLLFSSDSLRVRPARGVVRDLDELVTLQARPAPLPDDPLARTRIVLELARIDDEIKGLERLARGVDGLKPEAPAAEAPFQLPTPDRWLALHNQTEAALEHVLAAREAAQERRRAVERELQRHDERAALAVADAAPPKILRGCRFRLDDAADASAVDFDVEYFVPAARWLPSYSLHLEGGAARLTTAAVVAQASGEDWSQAALSFSSADLDRDTTLPQLPSWRLGRAQASSPRAYRPLPSDLPTLFHGYDNGPRTAPRPPPSPPPASPASSGELASFPKTPTDEVASFEEESTGALGRSSLGELQREELEDDDSDSSEGAVFADGAPAEAATFSVGRPEDDDDALLSLKAKKMMAPRDEEPMADRQRAAPPRMSAPSRASRAPAPPAPPKGGFGGGGPGRGGAFEPPEPPPELPPRLRTGWLRMAGADEPGRGGLVPLDPLSRLSWLLEDSDADAATQAALSRAVRALQNAAELLQRATPPDVAARRGVPSGARHLPFVLDAPSTHTLPTDGAWHRVVVRQDALPAAVEHKAVPRAQNDVWRLCVLDTHAGPGGSVSLLPGPVAVYEDGAFRVNAALGQGEKGGAALQVNLGVDPDVRVVGRVVNVHQEEKGLVSQTSRALHKVRVEVRSTRATPVDVWVHDRLPQPAPGERDITVTLLSSVPPERKRDEDAHGHVLKGGLAWRIVIEPGQLGVVEYSYAIDLPAKAELVGGNRRE